MNNIKIGSAIILCGYLIVSSVTVQDNFDNNPTWKIMSFNIRGDQPRDGENQWVNRKERVANIILFHEPTFLGVQEAKPHQLEYLDEELEGYERIGDGDKPGEFTVIYYKTRIVDLMKGSENRIWLSESPEEQSKGWDAKHLRVLVYGTFKDNSSGIKVSVFNTHFDHIGERARKESAKLTLSTIQEETSDESVVLMGDFNFTEDAEPYDLLISSDLGLKNASKKSTLPHVGPISRSSGFDVKNHSEMKSIDFIFINQKISSIKHAALPYFRNGYYPSDHLPIFAEVEKNNK